MPAALCPRAPLVAAAPTFANRDLGQRAGHDLVLAPADDNTVFPGAVFELGYVRDLGNLGATTVGIGVGASIYALGSGLRPYYGDAVPVGAMGFLRVRPVELFH